jgi:protoporphyrinogen oxidase
MARTIILGAGVMGLAAAYRSVALGNEVVVLEAGCSWPRGETGGRNWSTCRRKSGSSDGAGERYTASSGNPYLTLSSMQEELGYIEGGSETLVSALVKAIQARGVVLRFSEPVIKVEVAAQRVTAVRTARNFYSAHSVISTIPTPLVTPVVPDLPQASRRAYEAIANIGVTCVVMKLRRPVTPHFSINIADAQMPIPGIIEFSNLRPTQTGKAVMYTLLHAGD